MRIHQLQGYIASMYLVEYPDKLLLLDSGCRNDVQMVIDFIENNLHRSRYDLKLVIITHAHPDHSGGATLLKKLTHCKIASTELCRHWYQGMVGLIKLGVDIFLTLYISHRQGKKFANVFYSPYIRPDIILKDQDILPDFPDWQAISTVGHTNCDISLWHCQSKQVYIADVLIKLKHRYVYPFPVYYPNQYRQSLQQLSYLAPVTTLLAHGGTQHIPPEQWQSLIDNSPIRPHTLWNTIKYKLIQLRE